ncbi:DUF4190 domain-containing protein [Actinoplanes sp. TFC3]|uniref:DUF4190 domain-containing protein n=1 Tax=Actinoplanes sp. TFC3 TaxID=1710355 RepID=UPI00137B2EDC|nr:DUF4190 domain-containing protein [Actinoplanes sp. TFC3]
MTDQPYGSAPASQAPYGNYPGAPAPAPQDTSTNGFAIASLVTGIFGLNLFAIIFGFVGLSQIKKSGQKGRGLAIAGITLAILWIIGLILLFVLVLNAANDVKEQAKPNYTGDVRVTNLSAGDCVNGIKESTSLQNLPKTPCTGKHEGEVFAVFDLPAGDYPGADAVAKQAEDGCTKRFDSYSDTKDEAIQLFYLHPLEASWKIDRGVTCIATKEGGLTGSLKK